MSVWTSIGHRVGHLFRQSRFDADLSEEIRLHMELRVEELQRNGATADEAGAQARREFGSPTRIAEDVRDAWQFAWLDRLLSNVRYSLRQIRRRPGFAALVVLTLGLGAGANSAAFSIIDAVVFRSLPFPESDRLTIVRQRSLSNPITFTSPARLADWDRLNHTFQSLTGFYTEDVSEVSGDLPEKLTRAFVAPRFLEVWGVAPALGRDFTPDEERFGGPPAVVISDRFWRRRFDADAAILGRQLRFGDVSPTIVGIMPPTFQFMVRDVDLWWPVAVNPRLARVRASTWYTTIGRLKPGVSASVAQADMAIVQSQLAKQYPESDGKLTVAVQPLDDDLVGTVKPSLWLIFGSASVLLLIACVNVAGLLLVRGTERAHELAIRMALGASRRVVGAQLLTETSVLALAAALLGLAFAASIVGSVRTLTAGLPRVEGVAVDWRVTLYAIGVGVVITLVCSLLPLVQGLRRDVSRSALAAGHTRVSGRGRLQWTLAAAQITLAVVLLAGGGLLVRSFQKLTQVLPGFDPNHVLTFRVSASYAETGNYAALTRRIDRTLETVRAIPGVQATATAGLLPGVPAALPTELKLLEGRSDSEPRLIADNRYVSPSYFATMQIPVLAGEVCRPPDSGVVQGAMVNRSFANTYFPGSTPIGHRVTVTVGTLSPDPAVIQGIVADVREQGLRRAPEPTVYWCATAPGPSPAFLVRTSGDPIALIDTVRRALKTLEPARAVFGLTSLSERIDDASRETRLRTVILGGFATIALALACVGLYGTLSYVVRSRRREIGLRLALGASRGQIVSAFFVQALKIAAAACAVGLVLSIAWGRWLSAVLYEVSPTDPVTLGTITAIVLSGAILASLIPSIRGSLVEPMRVLRDQ